jgi:hypothetical protein
MYVKDNDKNVMKVLVQAVSIVNQSKVRIKAYEALMGVNKSKVVNDTC